MNIQIKLDSVQQAELKGVMKKNKRTYSQREIKKLFTNMLYKKKII